MSKEQIEEIRKDIFAAFGGYEKWEEDWQSLAKAVYNAGYRKQSGWISVDERLPKDCVRVLVYGETDIFIATRLNGDWFAPVHCDGEITHWMPLPEPPKMKGGAE